MKLYIEGHSAGRGWAVSKSWSDAECSVLPVATEESLKPVRFFSSRLRAVRFVERWNQMFATH